MKKSEIIGNKFRSLMVEYFGQPVIDKIDSENKALPPGVCASHDLCDANKVMGEAFDFVMGSSVNIHNDTHAIIWNRAWRIAFPY